jgi:hypothetical protein
MQITKVGSAQESNFVNAIDYRSENGLCVGEIGNPGVQQLALHRDGMLPIA